jgi:hypothetical protein
VTAAHNSVLERQWFYRPSAPSVLVRLSRLKSILTGVRRAPASVAIRPVTPRERWNALFVYLPDGILSPAHRYTLARLRELKGATAIICAAPAISEIPQELHSLADALYWKALSGFDFSAYALVVRAVADQSPGADLYVQNDSVLGPFADVDRLLDQAPWELSGFMGSASLENHVQSYAMMIRGVDQSRVDCLSSVMSDRWACDRWRDVVNLQETRLARVAAKGMSVGALWYAPTAGDAEISLGKAIRRKLAPLGPTAGNLEVRDPTLIQALDLAADGFPFLKKSLFTRNRTFQDGEALATYLSEQGHPPLAGSDHV